MKDKIELVKNLSKRKKKIIDDFFDVIDRYEDAFDRGDSKNALAYGRDVVAYIGRHQTDLNFSDAQLKEMRDSLANLEATTKNAEIANAEAEASSREARKAEQEYYEFLLAQKPSSKQRTEH